MRQAICAITASTLLLTLSAAQPASAQGAKQTVALTEISPGTLAIGYRSTKVVGSKVYNETKENIGIIDDLIVTPNGTVPYVVLSVGGFLGMGKHNVVVSASSLEVIGGVMTLHGGTKESLQALPSYTYTY